MSRLEELIAELCPDGIPYHSLGDMCYIKARIGWQRLNKSEYRDSGDYYLVTGVDITSNNRVDFSSCYYVSKERYEMDENIQLQNGDVILTKDGTIGKVALIEGMDKPGVLNSHLFVIRDKSGALEHKFLMYILLSKSFTQFINLNKTQGTIPGLNQATIIKFMLPVPPLEVQREIVRILDSFTELSAELSAEIAARKKQYEYYRDELLHLDGEHVTIEDLFDTRNGFTPSKQEPLFWEDGTLPWFKLDDINDKGRVLSDSYLHITPQALKKSGLFPGNSIIISTSATIGEYALITVPFLCNQRFTCMTVKPKYYDSVNIKYLMYYCPMLSKFCKEHLNQGNFASVDMKQFFKFEFVIPSVEKQNRIVSILDRFDTLCNDISSGLPAEIEARRKQYEYYRDKLLTFKERS